MVSAACPLCCVIANGPAWTDNGWRRFGEDVMQTMISWVDTLLQQHKLNRCSVGILDVGIGNGLLLLQLAKLGYSNLTGSDYSPQSIALSAKILQRHQTANVKLVVSTHTAVTPSWLLGYGFVSSM